MKQHPFFFIVFFFYFCCTLTKLLALAVFGFTCFLMWQHILLCRTLNTKIFSSSGFGTIWAFRELKSCSPSGKQKTSMQILSLWCFLKTWYLMDNCIVQQLQLLHRDGTKLWGEKTQITILLVCNEVKVCSILPCAAGHESHAGHHGDKIIKTSPWIFNSGWWMAETESVRAQAETERAAWEHICEGEWSCIYWAQAGSQVIPSPKETKNHFSKRFLPNQKDDVRSFPEPNMGSLLCLANVWTCVQCGHGGVSLPSPGWSPNFCHCYLHLCSCFSPNLCLKSALLQGKAIISSSV